jgi:hypothetical protein
MKRQHGQSMAEFAAAAAALSLLMLGTLAIAGYQEVDRRGIVAAREVAFRQAWRTDVDEAQVASRLHEAAYRDAAMRDPSGETFLVAGDDLVLAWSRIGARGLAGAAEAVMKAPLLGVGTLIQNSFDVSDQGLGQVIVQGRVAPLTAMPAPFNMLELNLAARFAMLDDSWHAAGPAHVRQRAGGLVPASALHGLNAIWQPLSIPLGILEPSLRELCLGLIEPDRIPEDRLGPGRTPLPGRCP